MTVNGLVFPASGTFGVINPATGEVFDHAPALAPDQLGSVIALVAELLSQRWSPQQISRHLRARFPDEPRMSLCHESIYRAIYQTGSLLLRPSPSVKMVTDSLRMAIDTLNAGERPLVHSDEGFQYRHTLWRDTLREAGLTQLMSRKGTCLDNAVMEGFFSHLKEEWFRIQKPGTLDEFDAGLTDYLRWWNTTRIQQRLGYLSPDEYRAQTPSIA